MDSISNVIYNRADDIFKSPAPVATDTPLNTSDSDDVIDLEAPIATQIGYNTADDNITSMVESSDDVLYQEEVVLPAPSAAPSAEITPEMAKTDAPAPQDLEKLKVMIYSMRDQLEAMLRFVNGDANALPQNTESGAKIMATGDTIIEGVFNGEKMVDETGKEYDVPPNYASKSKLVEGDKMKLTILPNGRYIYKQISQIERKRLVGELTLNGSNIQWQVNADGKIYKVLTASVTFYKGIAGDEVVFFVPKNKEVSWGAIEHIIHKK